MYRKLFSCVVVLVSQSHDDYIPWMLQRVSHWNKFMIHGDDDGGDDGAHFWSQHDIFISHFVTQQMMKIKQNSWNILCID